MTSIRSLRIASIQFDPCFKDVGASITRAESLMGNMISNTLDLLVLPEMALTGYCFDSLDDILPFLENANTGPTFSWGSSIASRLNCYVLVGFPQISYSPIDSTPIYSNSLLIIRPDGTLHDVYQKQFLYETDEKWCSEPEGGFKYFDLPFPTSSPSYTAPSAMIPSTFRLAPSICMDLNPKGFIAPFEAFELSSFAKESKVDVLVCSMNWLDSNQDDDSSEGSRKDEAIKEGDSDSEESSDEEGISEGGKRWNEVKSTLNYFAMRLTPLMGEKTVFVSCNRVGTEKGVRFTGSSCIMKLEDSPEVLAHASKKESEVITMNVRLG